MGCFNTCVMHLLLALPNTVEHKQSKPQRNVIIVLCRWQQAALQQRLHPAAVREQRRPRKAWH
jgi:hypothetical protein